MDFENRIRKLSSLIGFEGNMDQFNAEYEALKNDLTINPGARFELLTRLRRVGDLQLEYLMAGWLREDRRQWAPGWVQ